MLKITPKKFTYFIGVDVSRNELDYAVMRGKDLLFHREGLNKPAEILDFLKQLQALPGFTKTRSVFCMENSGIYCNHLVAALRKLKFNIVLENALKIKNSLGLLRGKSDKADAIRIARYIYLSRDHLTLSNDRRPVIKQLANLFALRNRLLNLQNALKTPLREQVSFVRKGIARESHRYCGRSLQAMQLDLQDIEFAIDELIRSDENLSRLRKIITSVPHAGSIVAVQLILSTNEFQDIRHPKKFACYAGVAPFIRESGNIKHRTRVSPIANKKVKALLHLCAIGSIAHQGELRTYYDRKVAEGKPKMSVLNALRNKIIFRIFSCVKEDRLYKKDHSGLRPEQV